MTRTLRGQKKKPLWGFCIGVYAGQYFDSETGLHYNYHRYYDPKIGRYLRADPLGLEAGPNLYIYVKNNPTNFIDPLGLTLSRPKRKCTPWFTYFWTTVRGSEGAWQTIHEDLYWTHLTTTNVSLPVEGVAGYRWNVAHHHYNKFRDQKRSITELAKQMRLCMDFICNIPTGKPRPEFRDGGTRTNWEFRTQTKYRSRVENTLLHYDQKNDSWETDTQQVFEFETPWM